MSKLGLVTILYNSDDVLEGFFKSLHEQTFTDYHLFIIDNSPSDQTDQLINRMVELYPIPAYTHIKSSENIGVAAGNNIGIKLSIDQGSSHVLLLNNDIEFYQHSLLKELMDFAENSKESLIIPKILYYGTNKIWMAGGKFYRHKADTIHVGEREEDQPSYNIEGYFNYAPTCFMLISNAVFADIGYMDEKYFVYYDDTDFIYRAIQRGFKVFYKPDLTIYHKVSISTGGYESNFSVYYSTRNRIYFIYKNLKGSLFIVALIWTFLNKLRSYIRFSRDQRSAMIRGGKDGLQLVK